MISGSTAAAVKNALPAFGGTRGSPSGPSPHAASAPQPASASRSRSTCLPTHHQVCITHGIWLPGPGTPQFSVRGCPDILAAERQARRLLRRCTIEQLIYSKIQAAHR